MAEGPSVTVGKLSEFCGVKFFQDVVQTSSFTIKLSVRGEKMKDLIDDVIAKEKERGDEQGAGVWRFRDDPKNKIFYRNGLIFDQIFFHQYLLKSLFNTQF